jgi:hypothetical protein
MFDDFSLPRRLAKEEIEKRYDMFQLMSQCKVLSSDF